MGNRLKIVLGIILVFMVVCLVFWVTYPSLLCALIENDNAFGITVLTNIPFVDVNRSTQPIFFDPVTMIIFECSARFPLQVACSQGDLLAVEQLLGAGADPNKISPYDCSAIQYAYRYPSQENRLEIAKALVRYGADVNLKNCIDSALFLEVSYSEGDIGIESEMENINFLVESGALVTNDKNETILSFALQIGRNDIALEILKSELVDLNYCDNQGVTALMVAAQNSSVDMIVSLLKYGADKTIISNDGKTAYDYALQCNSDDLIIDLLKFN